ncbi:acyl-CoA dehydrogenase [Sphingomonas paeninsulae]|jgi:alkylation response protein AidB-like acyl-CoA dehydrogenase|uniref:Acyl-CoA dehydrogenase n=1 Tax=Sphingomonas paeninsulae TaxID=2319844 RepID=A0A494TJ47_SPHPE|nr:acyl-CoA dehydrogenase family protein [Sphingomonas paeninsulae]AYJ87023.1 acyl-CoA dehydrogenase [Sphingomonas paeninsulae]
MQFALTAEQQLVSESARALFTDLAPTRRTTIASADGFDRGQWTTVAETMGFGGIATGERFGGSGMGSVELALIMIEMGRTLHPSPFLSSVGTALPLISLTADETQAARLIPAIARGEVIAAALLADDVTIEPVAGGFRLRGSGLVPFGHAADLFVIAVDGRLAVIKSDAAGVETTRHTTMDETRPLSTLRLDVVVPETDVLGGGNIERGVDLARVALAAECVGGADAVLDLTVDYAKQRIQFGRPIGSFQAIKHRLADMMIAVEAARTAVYYAAAAADEGDLAFAEAAAIAHSTAIEAFTMCAGNAIQLHGGIGFTWEHDAHLFFKRARSAATLLGTSAQSHERLAQLIGLDTVEN